MVNQLELPNSVKDPVILSWRKPVLTNENKEFFQGYNVTFSHNILSPMLSDIKRRKRNVPLFVSKTIMLGPDETIFIYNESCPYNDSLTLCPYSKYCFYVISMFAFKDIFIDASNPSLTRICTDTNEAGKLHYMTLFCILRCDMSLAPNGPPQNLSVINVNVQEIEKGGNFLSSQMESLLSLL